MTPTELRDELHQTRPFASLEQECYLNIARTAAVLSDAFEVALRPFGITGTQFNVLRILRGAEPDGLCRNELRDRMLNRMPDMTRLLDRMEEAGLVSRARGTDDRRQVSTRITTEGRALVDRLDSLVTDEHHRQLGHLEAAELRQLIELLTLARQNPG
jgi:DNA-binding MarR family transcriptional regulator